MTYELRKVQIRPPRVYRPSDVGRIARYCEADGGDKVMILASVLEGLGYEPCGLAAEISALIKLVDIVSSAAAQIGTSAAIQALIAALSRNVILKLPFVNRLILIVILALTAIRSVLLYIENGLKFERLSELLKVFKFICENK